MSELETFIGHMGFPVVMCLLLFYYVSTTNKQLENLINANHIELEHNTAILNNLQFIIKDMTDKVKDENVSEEQAGNNNENT